MTLQEAHIQHCAVFESVLKSTAVKQTATVEQPEERPVGTKDALWYAQHG